MKTLVAITAALLISTASFADGLNKNRTLTFKDSFGRIMSMPLMTEEAAEEMPFDQTEIFNEVKSERNTRIFDISNMSRPESAEAIPAELKQLFNK